MFPALALYPYIVQMGPELWADTEDPSKHSTCPLFGLLIHSAALSTHTDKLPY